MSDMIDRIAKAMWDSEPAIYAWGPQERHRVSWEEAVARDLAGVAIFRAFARAAIAAMREPDAAASLVHRAYELLDKNLPANSIGAREVWEVWKAMIDSALSPQGQ